MAEVGSNERVADIMKIPLKHDVAHVVGGRGDLRGLWTKIADVSKLASVVASRSSQPTGFGSAHRMDDGRAHYQDMPDGLTFEGSRDQKTITSELADILPPKLLKLVAKLGLRGVHFNTLVQKGGGVPLGHKIHEGKPVHANYYLRKAYRVCEPEGSPAGCVAYESAEDMANSIVFHSLGGRTRLPICSFQLTSFDTPDGVLSFPRAIDKGYFTKDAEPVLQLWGIRSPDRLRSFIRGLTGEMETENCPQPDVSSWGAVELAPNIEEKMVAYAHRIVTSALTDEDIRWRKLAEKYRGSTFKKEGLSAFYLDYLEVFAATLGEQLGILYSNRIIHYQMHAQNITLLGEVVDLDAILYPGYKSIYGEELSDKAKAENKIVMTDGKEFSEIEVQLNNVESRMFIILDMYFCLVNKGVIQSEDKEALQRRVDAGLMAYGRGFAKTGIGQSLKPADVIRNKHFLETHQSYLPVTEYGVWGDHFDPIGLAIKEINPIYRLAKRPKLYT